MSDNIYRNMRPGGRGTVRFDASLNSRISRSLRVVNPLEELNSHSPKSSQRETLVAWVHSSSDLLCRIVGETFIHSFLKGIISH